MDSLEIFTSKVEREIDGIVPGSLKGDTNYRDIPEWSSMHALIIIALAETEYDVTLTGEDMRKCQTVGDIYAIITSRIS